MGAPLGIGQAVLGMVDAERQKRDLASAAQGAAQMFGSLGTENGKKLAEMAMSDPRGIMALAGSVGGMHQLYAMEQANAGRQRVATATAKHPAGSREWFGGMANTAAGELEFGAAAQFAQGAAPKEIETEIKNIGAPGDKVRLAVINKATGEVIREIGAPTSKFAPPSSQPGWGFSYRVDAGGNPVFDVSQGVPGASPTDLRKVGATRRNAMRAFDNISTLNGIIDKSPAVASGFGRAGKIASGVAGAFESRGSLAPGTGDFVAGMAAPGANQHDIARYEANANSLISAARGLLTSDTAANMAVQEMERLRQITSVMDWTTNAIQTREVMKDIARLTLRDEVMGSVMIGAGSPYDPTTPEGLNKAIQVLRDKSKMSDDEIENALDDLVEEVAVQRQSGPLRQPPKPVRMPGGGSGMQYWERGEPPTETP